MKAGLQVHVYLLVAGLGLWHEWMHLIAVHVTLRQ